MDDKKLVVFGIYSHRPSFEYAICGLKAAGFPDSDISALFQEDSGLTDPDFAAATQDAGETGTLDGSGIVVAMTKAWASRPAAISIPGMEKFRIVGPLAAALAQSKASVASGRMGELSKILLKLGVPEPEAEQYQDRIEKGGVLLSVHCREASYVEKAKDSLKSTGAENICTSDSIAN